MLNYNIKLPPGFGRDRLTAAEFRALVEGKLKVKVKPGPKLRTNHRKDYATYRDGVLTITIHELPPSQNRWKTWHHMQLNTETQRWNDMIMLLARSANCEQFKRPVVKFRFFFPDGRSRDRKNFESWKPLLDGLTRAGIIKDDNYREIREEPADMEVDRQNPRTEIVVREG